MVAPVTSVSPHDVDAARAAAAAPSQEVGEEEFLNLLMTQLTNQDPLKPMDSAQFMDQIASMNTVKQLMEVNVGIDQMMLGLTSLNNQSAVDLVGKEVVARGDTVPHEVGETSHELQYELAAPAESVTVVVKDANGDIVASHDALEAELAGEHSWTWAPDATQADGDYTFEVLATDADGNSVAATTYVHGVVDELRFDPGVPVLMVNGNEITLDEILRVLAADAPVPPPAPEMPESFPALDSIPVQTL